MNFWINVSFWYSVRGKPFNFMRDKPIPFSVKPQRINKANGFWLVNDTEQIFLPNTDYIFPKYIPILLFSVFIYLVQ